MTSCENFVQSIITQDVLPSFYMFVCKLFMEESCREFTYIDMNEDEVFYFKSLITKWKFSFNAKSWVKTHYMEFYGNHSNNYFKLIVLLYATQMQLKNLAKKR